MREVPSSLPPSIHPSAWNGNSRKFACRKVVGTCFLQSQEHHIALPTREGQPQYLGVLHKNAQKLIPDRKREASREASFLVRLRLSPNPPRSPLRSAERGSAAGGVCRFRDIWNKTNSQTMRPCARFSRRRVYGSGWRGRGARTSRIPFSFTARRGAAREHRAWAPAYRSDLLR